MVTSGDFGNIPPFGIIVRSRKHGPKNIKSYRRGRKGLLAHRNLNFDRWIVYLSEVQMEVALKTKC